MASIDLGITPPGSLLVSPVESEYADLLTHVGAATPDTVLVRGEDNTNSLITRAYDLLAAKPLRDALIFDAFATVRPTRQSHNGAVVRMNFIDDLDDTPSTALLPEDFDVLPTPLKSYWTDITMK